MKVATFKFTWGLSNNANWEARLYSVLLGFHKSMRPDTVTWLYRQVPNKPFKLYGEFKNLHVNGGFNEIYF